MPTHDTLIVDFITAGPFQTNLYVVGCAQTKQGAIVDAGWDAPALLGMVQTHGLELSKVLQTHAHIDHVAALSEVISAHPVPLFLHPDDKPLYDGVVQQGAMFGLPINTLPQVTDWLEDGQVLELGALEARVILLPGHSPGSVVFYFEQQGVMMSGDVLFQGSIGRTDLPGGSWPAMQASLAKLMTYPDDTVVYCGHGPSTTIGRERRTNPFLDA